MENWSILIQKLHKFWNFNIKIIDFNWKSTLLFNQNLISTPDFKADRFCHSKLLESDVKSSMIQFEMAICLSLPLSHCTKEVGLKFSSFLNIDGKKLNSTQKLFETKFYKYTSSSFGITYFFLAENPLFDKNVSKKDPSNIRISFLGNFLWKFN